MTRALLISLMALMLAACDSRSDLGEVQQFVEEAVNRPPGPIEPLPQFVSYEPFTYSAAGLRSPFNAPVDISQAVRDPSVNQVRPDLEREREELEQFALTQLTMVGSLSRDNRRWALVRDGSNTVHRVTVGNYIGPNHGRVVSITDSAIELIEIVRSGEQDIFIERPQTLSIGDAGSAQ